ncbi:ATP-binding protein [Tropicimonas sp. S265A]|uniref:ATP-binding protein n=1 Tax=Tropicimonas sp. S265A TaxID=3415134 RepID=UPI003C7B2769
MSDPDPNEKLSLRFASAPEKVRDALSGINAFLTARDFSEDDRATTEVVMAELLNNIVEHAYLEDPTGEICLSAGFCNGVLCFEVTDRGRAMPQDVLPEGKLPSSDGPLETLPEGGFGWFLLHSLTENLRYCRMAGTNVTRFSIPTTG